MTWDTFRTTVGLLVAVALSWWVQLGLVVQVLLILMALDVLSGLAAGFVEKSLDSSRGWKGIVRKTITLMLVVMAHCLEPVLAAGIGAPQAHIPLGEAVAIFFAAVEGLSILENAARAGVPIPDVIRQALIKLKEAGSSGGTQVGGT